MQKHFFMQNNAKMKCAAYHAGSNLLVTGFSNGLFGLYELPEFNMIHTLRYFASYVKQCHELSIDIKYLASHKPTSTSSILIKQVSGSPLVPRN